MNGCFWPFSEVHDCPLIQWTIGRSGLSAVIELNAKQLIGRCLSDEVLSSEYLVPGAAH